MQSIDWTIVIVFIVALTGLAFYAKRFNRGVADFLAANRCAGRYLLSVSQGIAGIGAISFVAEFQRYYAAGFSGIWWLLVFYPINLFLALTGWIAYRYRETRALTMAQFFEVRYSRNFRVFAGILAWVSGVINMGIFPAVTARLFIYFCGLPATFSFLGFDGISTFVVIMLIELAFALLFTFLGGMIAVMVTDFVQGMFCNIVFLIVLIFILTVFKWDVLVEAVQMAPAGASMLNPFNTSKAEGFNTTFFLMFIFISIYSFRAWQGTQGYNASARNAHEAKMSGIISQWRAQILLLLLAMIPIGAYALMHHVDFSAQAAAVQHTVDAIGNETIQNQMLVPVALAKMLPVGLLGLVVAVFFAAQVSTDDTYLHSWGSIFVQDVILPFRKKGFTPKQHTLILRLSILFVAVFIFFFSLLFQQNDYILMFMFLTGAIYLGGAGAVIVGGLYWKRGTTAAAWTAMVSGCILAVGGLLMRTIWVKIVPDLMKRFPESTFLAEHSEKFPFDGIQITFFAGLFALIAYLLVSLWGWLVQRKPAFNMNRMLHRGKYAITGEHGEDVVLPPTGWKSLLPSKEFTGWDKFLYYTLTAWNLLITAVVISVTAVHFIWGTTDEFWIKFWGIWVGLIVVLGTVTTIWFVIGGTLDMKQMFADLRKIDRNTDDDGRVVGHHSLADETLEVDNSEILAELKADAKPETEKKR